MEMIALFAWSKRHGMSYSQAQKLFERGQLKGARREGSRVLVPNTVLPPERQTITCMICKAQVRQITPTHLRTHKLTLDQYRRAFPAAPLMAEDVTEQIAASLTGIKRSVETKAKVSENRKGVIPEEHPRHKRGTYKASEETRRKMSAAKKGKKLSLEHREAIREGRKHVVVDPSHIIAVNIRRRGQPSPLKGRKFVTEPRASIAVWVEKELRDLAKQAAFLRGQTLSTYVANLIRKDLKR